MSGYKIISSDSHILEPADIWTSRMEPKYRDQAPRLVRLEDGDWWFCGDVKVTLAPVNATIPGRRFQQEMRLTEEDKFGPGLLGGFIPGEHVKDMDADGVYGGMIYPSIGLAWFSFDPGTELLNAIFRAYNDWLAEFCSAYPDRLKGIAMINLEDVNAGVKEMERCAQMGLAGVMITTYPEGVQYVDEARRSYDSPIYDPFWAAAQDLDVPISLHISTNRPVQGERIGIFNRDSSLVKRALLINADHWVRISLTLMILGGVFERFPGLKVVSVEHELCWVPYFIDQLDYAYTQRVQQEGMYRFKEDMLPSDFFHRNVFLSFQQDGLGIRLRNKIGVDSLMWGSDYPHPEGTFPRSREILEEILADCTEEEKATIAGANAARLYQFD